MSKLPLTETLQVDNETSSSNDADSTTPDAVCDLIFATLHLLLLRAHAYVKQQRIGRSAAIRTGPAPSFSPPPLLLPIVDLLQYRAFCDRVHAEIGKVARGLSAAGMPVKLSENRVGECGAQLVTMLTKTDMPQSLGGETLLRIDNRCV